MAVLIPNLKWENEDQVREDVTHAKTVTLLMSNSSFSCYHYYFAIVSDQEGRWGRKTAWT